MTATPAGKRLVRPLVDKARTHEATMLRALADQGFTAVESFNRASMRAFESAVERAQIVIIASELVAFSRDM